LINQFTRLKNSLQQALQTLQKCDIVGSSHDLHEIVMTKRNWKKYLTTSEQKELIRLERQLASLAVKILVPKNLRTKIQNRATARAGKA